MSDVEVYKLEDILIDLTSDHLRIQHPDSKVFTSLNSKYLDSYQQGVIRPENFKEDIPLDEISEEYHKNYNRFLGFKNVHLGSLEMAGFLNPDYDISFGFEISIVLSKPHLICDHDSLMNLLLYGQDVSVHTLFENEYTQHSEILSKELDLKKSCLTITYSDDAEQKIKHFFSGNIKPINMSEIRKKAIESYFK